MKIEADNPSFKLRYSKSVSLPWFGVYNIFGGKTFKAANDEVSGSRVSQKSKKPNFQLTVKQKVLKV
jgi:hypothetical protein